MRSCWLLLAAAVSRRPVRPCMKLHEGGRMVRMESMDGPHPAQKSPNGAPRRDPGRPMSGPVHTSRESGTWFPSAPRFASSQEVPGVPALTGPWVGCGRAALSRMGRPGYAVGTLGSILGGLGRDGASVSQCQLIISHLSRGLAGRAMETWRHGMGKLCRRQPPSSSSSSSYRIMTD